MFPSEYRREHSELLWPPQDGPAVKGVIDQPSITVLPKPIGPGGHRCGGQPGPGVTSSWSPYHKSG